ncbi:F-box domain-containing protein [Diplogelasinospora grovesii]|uniref:F-box domain-containing protein n=1 Tax=Diplogelasinospora grovesii TaxID=303347 RepID=A0AAN6RZ01_9PEZI|nr:F-box domain-containing protein [Diplogelasinospora grovesii]
MSIAKLPYKLVLYVVQHLNLEDVRNLSLTCRRFQYLVHEENIAMTILNLTIAAQEKAPASLEAQTARTSKRYSPELRRLVKRREAVSSVSPYLAAIVAVAETWLFENGVLCYIHDRQLRILDLHHSASSEIVVNIRRLLNEAIVESQVSLTYKFQLLYYAHDIVSCLYTHLKPERASWLVVFNARENRILTAPRLASGHKIFVRNNDKFLYYGTHTDFGGDDFRRWMIKGYDISENRWFEHKANIPEMAGFGIGSIICFEIIDGYFYGLSNQTTFEVTGIDLTSYYVCFRFPLSCGGFYEIEQAAR